MCLGGNVHAAGVECALTEDWVLACACVCVWRTLMVLMHAVAKHRGVVLVVRHLEKSQKTQPDTFWTRKKNRMRDWLFVVPLQCFQKPDGGCVLVHRQAGRASSLLGARSDSQSLGSRACQLWFGPVFSTPCRAESYVYLLEPRWSCKCLCLPEWQYMADCNCKKEAFVERKGKGVQDKVMKKWKEASSGLNLMTRGCWREQKPLCYRQIKEEKETNDKNARHPRNRGTDMLVPNHHWLICVLVLGNVFLDVRPFHRCLGPKTQDLKIGITRDL